jgi:hypothetical protein
MINIRSFPAVFNTSLLNGCNGFNITSGGTNSVAGVGDINGDGKLDLIVGYAYSVYAAYVIFGADNFPATLSVSTLNGNNGFRITSSSTNFGYSIAGAGDVNGDGKADLVIGAYGTNTAYVIFGAKSFPATLDTSALTGTNGFNITSSSSRFGHSVAGAGDVNGDGKADLIIGADGANTAYVIFGADNFPATLSVSTLNGNNGFRITSSSTNFGYSVAGAGDINGNGKSDFIVGAYSNSAAYVIFGASSFPSTLDTSDLNGTTGFSITVDYSSSVAGAGDINGDGKPDLIVGVSIPIVNEEVPCGRKKKS